MKLKTLVVVVVILAAVSVGVHFLTRPAKHPPTDARVGQLLVARNVIEQARTIGLTENGKAVTLTKAADGNWQVTNYYDFPADFTKLSRLIGDLTTAKLDRLVTQNPERIGALEFKDTGITISDGANQEPWSLTIGKYAEGGGRFVRFGKENKAFLTRLNAYLDVEPKNWADASLLSLKPEDISSVEISFPNGDNLTAKRTRKEDSFASTEAPKGKRLKNESITSLISSAGSIRFSDTSDLTDPNAVAAREHSRNIRFTTFDGKTIDVALGRKPEQKIVKAPEAKKDGSTGPAALGSVADLAKTDDKSKSSASADAGHKADEKGGPAKAAETTETIPAGPVFVVVKSSDSAAPVNALMKKRAFQVYESAFTSLPASEPDMFEDAPAPTPAPVTPTSSSKPSTP